MPTEAQLDALFAFLRGGSARKPRVMAMGAAIILVCAIVVVGLRPAATQDLPFWLALIHWVLHFLGGALLFALIAFGALRLKFRPTWAIGLAICLLPLGLAPLSLGIEAAIAYVSGAARQEPDSLLEELRHVAIPAIGLTTLVAFLGLNAAVSGLRQHARVLARLGGEPGVRTLFPDLPHHLGDDLLSVSANDHYVQVRLSGGSVLLSGKFSDCVEKLAPMAGLQVHRSHWVRNKHIVRVKPQGSSYVCVLSDGFEIPVSRRRYADLKRVLSQRI